MPYEGGMLTGPPVPPPDVPTLSAYPMQGESSEGNIDSSKVGGLLRLFYAGDKLFDSIAAAAPGYSKQIDIIKRSMSDLRTAILSKGASGTSRENEPTLTGGSTPLSEPY